MKNRGHISTLVILAFLATPSLFGQRLKRLIPQDENPEIYTLSVENETAAQTARWWVPFLEKMVRGYCFDLYILQLHDRPQIGDKAVVIDFGGDAHLVQLVELAPGATTKWHGYGWEGEPFFFIVQGQGETEYRAMLDGMPTNRYTWKKNSLLAVPFDHQVRHINKGETPARMLAITGYGINLYPYVREEVRGGTERPETRDARAMLMTRATYPGHYVEDLREHPVTLREARGNKTAFFNLMSTVGHRSHRNVHISEAVGDKCPAHKHDGQPIFYILKGGGYDIWSQAPDLETYHAALADGSAMKAPYTEGTLCGIPPGPHWHQHFSTHPTEHLRYLAIVSRRVMEEKLAPTEGER